MNDQDIQALKAERDQWRRQALDLAAELEAAHAGSEVLLCQRDQATASYQASRQERDELSARLYRILCAHDVCSEIGRPCLPCQQAFAEKLDAVTRERDVAQRELGEVRARLRRELEEQMEEAGYFVVRKEEG